MNFQEDQELHEYLEEKNMEKSVQADLTANICMGSFTFSCEMEGSSVGTMCSIPQLAAKGTQTSETRLTADVAVGPDDAFDDDVVSKGGSYFRDFSSIRNDETMVALCVVPLALFLTILQPLKIVDVRKISHENRLLIFLTKLKLVLPFIAISVLFGIHRATAARIFTEVLETLSDQFWNCVFWPSRFAVQDTVPECFPKKYSDCLAIIDCTEISLERPPTVEQQIYFYSQYKGKFTAKFLIAISPTGFISFVSYTYGGRSTDSNITVDFSFLELVEPGDVILADKGFPQIRTSLADKRVELIMPPFASKEKPKFSGAEMDDSYKIASVRIHVERIIGYIKRFRILKEMNNDLLPYIDPIF